MSRWLWFLVCAFLGLLLLVGGWLLPIHLRAVDTLVLQRAGKGTPSLVDTGLSLLKQKRLGAAEIILEACLQEQLLRMDSLAPAITNVATQHPGWEQWGGGEPHLEILFATGAGPNTVTQSSTNSSGTNQSSRRTILPLTDWVIRLENRGMGIELLRTSPRPLVQSLMQCRLLTNTVIFPPSASSSGQALDAALSVCGLLAEEGHLSGGMSNALAGWVTEANRGGDTEKLENLLLDFMSLGQRMNWGQLAVFVEKIEDPLSLHTLASRLRQNEADLPVIYSSVMLSGDAVAVTDYIGEFSKSGLEDVGASLRYGAGGLNELLHRKQRSYSSNLARLATAYEPVRDWQNFALEYCWKSPRIALPVKWLFFLLSGFLMAAALHQAWPRASALEEPLRVRGFHVVREILFAVVFLLAVLLLSEPFLAQDSQKAVAPFRLRLPTVGSAVPALSPHVNSTIMNQLSLLTLLLFFVLQGLIYVACVIKLAEIRRQRIPARMKLKLLENEDHLFDAGLYLGFVGTIISLILVSLGVIKPSLMAAYSSTSFGILFVSFFKIFHLRPARRKLILETEAAERAESVPTTSVVVPS